MPQIQSKNQNGHFTFCYLVILAILAIVIAILVYSIQTKDHVNDLDDVLKKYQSYKDTLSSFLNEKVISPYCSSLTETVCTTDEQNKYTEIQGTLTDIPTDTTAKMQHDLCCEPKTVESYIFTHRRRS